MLILANRARTAASVVSRDKLKTWYREIMKLKAYLWGTNREPQFILQTNPFDNYEEDDLTTDFRLPCVIIGRVLPTSEIYRPYPISVEIELDEYPMYPPNVRLLTRIYHPNVTHDGESIALDL